MTPEFVIAVHDVDIAGKQFDLPVRVSWMRGAFEGTEVTPGDTDGRIDLRLSKSGTDIVVCGSLDAMLVVACARCLEPARIAVREDLRALAVLDASAKRATARKRGRDDDSEAEEPLESDLVAYDGETLVLDDIVRDQLLLGIPMLPLCSESCPGIRPVLVLQPTETLGVDARLQPLLHFRKNST
jgi:uncharacterized protein